MKLKSLAETRKTLHDLWNHLPALKARCSKDVVERHVKLIAFYQAQYDQLISSNTSAQSDAAAAYP